MRPGNAASPRGVTAAQIHRLILLQGQVLQGVQVIAVGLNGRAGFPPRLSGDATRTGLISRLAANACRHKPSLSAHDSIGGGSIGLAPPSRADRPRWPAVACGPARSALPRALSRALIVPPGADGSWGQGGPQGQAAPSPGFRPCFQARARAAPEPGHAPGCNRSRSCRAGDRGPPGPGPPGGDGPGRQSPSDRR